MDTRAQNSWKELIEKEASTRVQCRIRDEETKDEDEWFKRSKYTQSRPFSVNQLPTITFPPRPVRHKPADILLEHASKLKDGTKTLNEMKAPDEKTKKLLFDGFTKEEKGRYQYLRARTAANPEDKYEFPLLSSWDYGWKLNEVAQKFKTPPFGRSKIVEESFYRRNGVFEFKPH